MLLRRRGRHRRRLAALRTSGDRSCPQGTRRQALPWTRPLLLEDVGRLASTAIKKPPSPLLPKTKAGTNALRFPTSGRGQKHGAALALLGISLGDPLSEPHAMSTLRGEGGRPSPPHMARCEVRSKRLKH